MSVLFYRREPSGATPPAPLPPGVMIRIWRPAEDGAPPRGSRRPQNLVWWGWDLVGVFPQRRFAEISLWREGRLVHRLILTPRWYRFPFMAPQDLQVGDLWTHPDFRGRGLAHVAIDRAHREAAGCAGQLWYLVEADNVASVRLIKSCGYRLVGAGRRVNPLGIGALGQFHLDQLQS